MWWKWRTTRCARDGRSARTDMRLISDADEEHSRNSSDRKSQLCALIRGPVLIEPSTHPTNKPHRPTLPPRGLLEEKTPRPEPNAAVCPRRIRFSASREPHPTA